MIEQYYCKERLHAGHSCGLIKGLKGPGFKPWLSQSNMLLAEILHSQSKRGNIGLLETLMKCLVRGN